jgi:hypothetical protein
VAFLWLFSWWTDADVMVAKNSQTNDDWWDVEYNGNRGYAPASYIDVLPPPEAKKPPPPAKTRQYPHQLIVIKLPLLTQSIN